MILCEKVENQRQFYIDQLHRVSVYTIQDLRLYELSLSELKQEFFNYVK